MRILFFPSIGTDLVSIQRPTYSVKAFKQGDLEITISQLTSGNYYLDLQDGENLPSEGLIPYIDTIMETDYVKETDVPSRELGEYRYGSASAMVSMAVPPKSWNHKLAGHYCYYLEFNAKNPADIKELRKRFFLGTILPYKIAGKQPVNFKETLELLLNEHNPKNFFERLKICLNAAFKMNMA
ncbi:MAG: hypothetical protein JWM20_694 [Patescibacteria group bacterium]|nr:hypothetical protein [Patescibacteria group bacterium]